VFTDKLKKIADERNITLSQLVLNWTILQPGITCALAGARNATQVLENVKAAEFRLTSEEINNINSLISHLKLETKILSSL
jgi:aryl-alcohol dehydrogenase-like predicted oxidoreductase